MIISFNIVNISMEYNPVLLTKNLSKNSVLDEPDTICSSLDPRLFSSSSPAVCISLVFVLSFKIFIITYFFLTVNISMEYKSVLLGKNSL